MNFEVIIRAAKYHEDVGVFRMKKYPR